MHLKYNIGTPSKELKRLVPQYEAFNKLLGSLELNIVHDKFIEQVYGIASRAIDARISLEKKQITKEETEKILEEKMKSFQALFNTYIIFSDEFKLKCYGLFWTVCWYEFN